MPWAFPSPLWQSGLVRPLRTGLSGATPTMYFTTDGDFVKATKVGPKGWRFLSSWGTRSWPARCSDSRALLSRKLCHSVPVSSDFPCPGGVTAAFVQFHGVTGGVERNSPSTSKTNFFAELFLEGPSSPRTEFRSSCRAGAQAPRNTLPVSVPRLGPSLLDFNLTLGFHLFPQPFWGEIINWDSLRNYVFFS